MNICWDDNEVERIKRLIRKYEEGQKLCAQYLQEDCTIEQFCSYMINYNFRSFLCEIASLGIKIERAVAVDAGFRILPKTEDEYRRIVRLFREEDVPHHTFPLPSERNIHAVVRGIPAMFSEQKIKGELEQRGYTPLHITRLKRSGGAPMPLVVVILPKIEKSQQLFNEHELLGLAIRIEKYPAVRVNLEDVTDRIENDGADDITDDDIVKMVVSNETVTEDIEDEQINRIPRSEGLKGGIFSDGFIASLPKTLLHKRHLGDCLSGNDGLKSNFK
ncbi:unnamed protein product [Acanthoscelides obtectus]|uniref:Uncharacterized protein n=1 Tax=Acanthoscelides obtectus TaxID=200917 RepID=A0A9P0M9Z2_ACAOB|nr:unnamed protein product [Acanthoscelides obtectus]CAK1624160.1 hypothetical protein AOBTE_LOCUS2361 [Acanthoscelides obtectus]